MYHWRVVTVGELFRVSRLLREVALAAAGDPGEAAPSEGLVVVTDDIVHHDDTTVTETAARTGMAQSLVSKVVGQLHHGGVVETVRDETDRRRTRIRVTDLARSQILPERARRTASAELRKRLPELDDKALAHIEAVLDQLARQVRN
jgi:DNA-binding MarR family transcriptional regulator